MAAEPGAAVPPDRSGGRFDRELSALAQHRPAFRQGGRVERYAAKVWAVLVKDLRAELRSREVFSTMILFGLLAALIFGLAFDLRVPRSQMVAPGILWVIVLFAGVLGLNRSFGAEVDRGTLAGLLLAPVERSALLFGKMAANLLYMLLLEALLLPVLLVLFDVNLFRPLIVLGLLLGSVGYVGVGTFFAALTANSRSRETMLPVLLLPVMVPVFIAGVALTAGVVDGRALSGLWRWAMLLGLYDLLFVTIAYLVFDLIWEN